MTESLHNPDIDIKSLVDKADDLLKNRDSKQAIVIIQQVLEVERDNIEALKIHGQSLVELKQIKEALTIFQKALQIESKKSLDISATVEFCLNQNKNNIKSR
jgi:Flp pilus assembly protein TadD